MTAEVNEVIETVSIPDTAASLAAPPRAQTSFQKEIAVSKEISIDDMVYSGMISQAFSDAIVNLYSFSTADGIARFFASKGIKGDRNILESCPISQYTATTASVEVETNDSGICTSRLDSPRRKVSFPLSSAMKDFIENFDAGLYPELVR